MPYRENNYGNGKDFYFIPPHEGTNSQDFNYLKAQYEYGLKMAGDKYLKDTRLNLQCRQVWISDSKKFDVSDESVVVDMLQEDEAETFGALQEIATTADALFRATEIFSDFVPEQDRRLFNEAQVHSVTSGFENDEILQIFSKASSQESFDALRMAFDAKIFEQARKKVGYADDDTLEHILSKASSEQSYRVMRMALDREIFLDAKGMQHFYSDDVLKKKFSKVSSPESYKAMRMALDIGVYSETSSNVSYILTPSDDQVKRVLSRASSPQARKIIEDLLWENVDKRNAYAAEHNTGEINILGLVNGALKRMRGKSGDTEGPNGRPTQPNGEQPEEPSYDSWVPSNRKYTKNEWQPNSRQEKTEVTEKDPRPDYEQAVEKDIAILRNQGLSDEEIQRRLRKTYHPDHNPDDPGAENKFKHIDYALGIA